MKHIRLKHFFSSCSAEYYTMKSDLESTGIWGRQADRHQFWACLVIFGIKGNDEDDTDANPTEGDDWVIKAKQLSYVPSLLPPPH